MHNKYSLQNIKSFFKECEKDWPALQENPKLFFQKVTKLLYQVEELEKLITD